MLAPEAGRVRPWEMNRFTMPELEAYLAWLEQPSSP